MDPKTPSQSHPQVFRSFDPQGSTDFNQLTTLLNRWHGGEQEVIQDLWPLLEQPLKRISHNALKRLLQPNQDLMCTTELIHEAFPKLAGYQLRNQWNRRSEFFALAKKIMLWLLLDIKKSKQAQISQVNQPLQEENLTSEGRPSDKLIDLERAIDKLNKVAPSQAEVLKMRYFEELSVGEIISHTGTPRATIYLHLKAGLGFLKCELSKT